MQLESRLVGLMLKISDFISDKTGGFAVYAAVLALPLLLTVGFGVDMGRKVNAASELQNAADAASLAIVKKTTLTNAELAEAAADIFYANSEIGRSLKNISISTKRLSAARVSVTVTGDLPTTFMQVGGYPKMGITVQSESEMGGSSAASPCITVLANTSQALLLNSGANLNAPKCELHVDSTSNPAFIHNAGVKLDLAKLCVKGKQYINNGKTIPSLETGCKAKPDPYVAKFKEPVVSASCETSGWPSGSSFTLNPGVHCATGFHSGAKITFKPGLHIIKGRMIIDAGGTVIANGVTFYFPDTDSEIRANGALTFTATAPASGLYKGVLMFEKTSDSLNNANKRQYIFNGSLGETLEGIIYLPNRDVTYNSTTNVSDSKINMVVNTMIVNSAKWKFSGYESPSGVGAGTSVRLVK
jgi:Flp pilus assembly protein TadG